MIEHPETQARMRMEAASVVGNLGMLSQLQDSEQLNYIEALAHKTMRLKQAAPLISLETIEDVTIGGVAIPKHTALMMLTLHGGLQEIHFADADQFRPERRLELAQPCAYNKNAFVPFGAGPRFCPGRQLAMMEIKRSWLCCVPNFVAGLFFGLNLFEDHPNVEDQMAGTRQRSRLHSIPLLCLYSLKLEHHPAWTNPPYIVPQ